MKVAGVADTQYVDCLVVVAVCRGGGGARIIDAVKNSEISGNMW